MPIQGKDAARQAALASIEQLERNFAKNIALIAEATDHYIKALTPVNTGQAVRNYIWTRNEPNTVVYEAINNGPPGHTNRMALGSEPRRKPNEAASHETLLGLGLSANPFGMIYLTNLSPDIEGLELGLLPGPPLRSRSPNGMFGVTSAFVKALIEAKGVLK